MASKNVTITEETYQKLRAHRRADESFSDVIEWLTTARTRPIDLLDPERSGHEAARRWMESHDDEPTFALREALRGAAWLDGVDGVDDLRDELLWLEPLPFSDAAAAEATTIEAELREGGDEVSVADCPFAGTARSAGATVVTADPDFERVRGLDVERYDVDD